MESAHVALQAFANELKQEMMMLDNMVDPCSLVSPSAYDTAWLAMVQDDQQPERPMFIDCLDWLLNNQRGEGFWGDCDAHGMPTIETLPATLACIIALNKWNVGKENIDKGLEYIRRNTEKLLGKCQNCPRWFAIMFPAMLELAHDFGLDLAFPSHCRQMIKDICYQRQKIFESKKLVDEYDYLLLSFLEAHPSTYIVSQEDIIRNLNTDGSLFQSPSATARAFMLTGNQRCLAFLKSLVQRCPHGVPQTYPLDEELAKLCIINQLQNLGIAEYFSEEIKKLLSQLYENSKNQEAVAKPINSVAVQLHKDSLAFWIFRMHGYSVSPGSFCWFLTDDAIQDNMEANHELFLSTMLSVYRATELMFPGEYELEEARTFSRKLLEQNQLQRMIKHELSQPWIARLEHLENRMWIEDENFDVFWTGKASSVRLLGDCKDKLTQLALRNYKFRQSVYRRELEELKMWTKEWGLSDLGFGREKTVYCYFAIAASCSWPYNSPVRMIVAKSGILITVADDFFDMEGSLDELKALTNAVRRWDADGLRGHGKIIFDALNDIVRDTAERCVKQQGSTITEDIRLIWCETFVSWLKEAEWSKNGHIPSMDEYLQNGLISIATHTMVLPVSCLFNPGLPSNKLKQENSETLIKLLMLITRLLNDVQSYEKELEEGKMNSVVLHLRGNSDMKIKDSVAYIKEIIDRKRKEFLKTALMDGPSDLPKSCKKLYLSCYKVFEMFYNSSNRYDSDTALLQDIHKAIYAPINVGMSKPLEHRPLLPPPALHRSRDYRPKKEYQSIDSRFLPPFKRIHSNRIITAFPHAYVPVKVYTYTNMYMPPKLPLCFI